VVRASHTPKMPTSRKSAMVSRLWSNPSIQISHQTTRRRAIRGNVPPNAPDKHVTNGVVGSLSQKSSIETYKPEFSILSWREWSTRNYLFLIIGFPGLFAGLKGNGWVPKADREIAVRATPEPPLAPYTG
jgi:hypothetical protein